MAEYPKFWDDILRRLRLKSFDGIENIRIILNFMGYTTLQSITKLRKPKDFSSFQIEVAKLNTNSQFCATYPHLQNWHLGHGSIQIIKDISNAASMPGDIENLDTVEANVKEKIYQRCVKVASNLSLANIMVDLDAKSICEIICPFALCNQLTKLSLIKQANPFAPPKFNTYNFERHIITLHAAHPNKKRKRDENQMAFVDETTLGSVGCDISQIENYSSINSSTPIRKEPENQLLTPKTENIRQLQMKLSMANQKIEELEKNVSQTPSSSASASLTPKSARIEELLSDLSFSGKITGKLREENICLRHKVLDVSGKIRTICRIKPDTTGDCFDLCYSSDGTNIEICKFNIY